MDSLDILTYVTLGALGATFYLAATMARAGARWRSPQSGAKRGPVPGYALYPASFIASELVGTGRPFSLHCVESFHSGGRSRLVLTCRLRRENVDAKGIRDLAASMREVGQEVVARTKVDAVAIELSANPSAPTGPQDWLAIFAPDRRGFSGTRPSPSFVLATPQGSESPASSGRESAKGEDG